MIQQNVAEKVNLCNLSNSVDVCRCIIGSRQLSKRSICWCKYPVNTSSCYFHCCGFTYGFHYLCIVGCTQTNIVWKHCGANYIVVTVHCISAPKRRDTAAIFTCIHTRIVIGLS